MTTRRPKWPKGYDKLVYDKTKGVCYHCKKKIEFNQRTKKQGENYWEIDHYPVQYKDIKDQCCIGVRDPLDIDNLVPSCGNCNKSHKYEKQNIYCCCLKGSQFPCKKICTIS